MNVCVYIYSHTYAYIDTYTYIHNFFFVMKGKAIIFSL